LNNGVLFVISSLSLTFQSLHSYESLENLHTTGSWSRQSYTSGLTNRPHSALGSTGSYRSGRSSLGPGSAIFSTGLKQALSASNVHSPPITTTHETSVPESRSNSQQSGRYGLLKGNKALLFVKCIFTLNAFKPILSAALLFLFFFLLRISLYLTFNPRYFSNR